MNFKRKIAPHEISNNFTPHVKEARNQSQISNRKLISLTLRIVNPIIYKQC